MKKLPFLNSPRKRTKKIPLSEYGSGLVLPSREKEIKDFVNREAERFEKTPDVPIPKHLVGRQEKKHTHWLIFFKTAVSQLRP